MKKDWETKLERLLAKRLSKGHFGGTFTPQTCLICKETEKSIKRFIKRLLTKK